LRGTHGHSCREARTATLQAAGTTLTSYPKHALPFSASQHDTGHRSVAVSSNLHPSGFDELMPKTLATATVDRLLHHAHLCQTTGDSVRLSQALAGKGVKPLE
jgi:hypothetical protein